MGILSPSTSFPVKCLLWQYDELMRNPLEGVNAAPLEDDIFEWHGNLYFPEEHQSYPGMVLHFILRLPKDFPNSTPHMELLTTFEHSHVFGGSICFSLLKEFEWHFQGHAQTVFWNPSRTIRSLLESVYVFLTVDEDARVGYQVSKSRRQHAIANAKRTLCGRCGHNPGAGNVWPPEESWLATRIATVAPSNSTTTPTNEQQVCSLAMYQDLTSLDRKNTPQPTPAPQLKPSEYKSRFAVTSISASTKATTNISVAQLPSNNLVVFDQRAALIKAEANELVVIAQEQSSTRLYTAMVEDFRCSISGVAFHYSNKVVLGYGVNVVRRERDGSIESITTDLTPISMEIFFKGRIRKSALGAPMTHFFPFAINEDHWQKAKRVLPGCVNAILRNGPEDASVQTQEDRLLFVVGELWKSMAVLMMKGGTHASEKVLKGFCSLHHILLLVTDVPDPVMEGKPVVKAAAAAAALVVSPSSPQSSDDSSNNTGDGQSWSMVVRHQKKSRSRHETSKSTSDLLSLVNRRVRGFARNPRMRHKAQCPDFGRFLPQLLLSDVTWKAIQEPFIGELLTRNARWICRASRDLGVVKFSEQFVLSNRAQRSWMASNTGLKLTAFQIRFALNVVPWARKALPSEVVSAYEDSSHQPHLLLVRSMYNLLGGRPTQDMLSRFQEETKTIEAMSSFGEFFRMIDMLCDDMAIQQMLCDAMENSRRFGYHRS